jgi:PPOX class probable F420-dependent enzyme
MGFQPDERLLSRFAEPVAWLTTVTPTSRPAPRPVWFVFDGEALIVFSSSRAAKVRHIRANPNVSFNFNTDAGGGDVYVISGKAEFVEGIAASTTPGYLEKYEKMYAGIGLDKSSFDAAYDLGIRITPERFWAL